MHYTLNKSGELPLFVFKGDIDMDLRLLTPQIEKKLNELGYELSSISTRKEKGDLILSIVVDKVDPIDMNEIVSISEKLSSFLDEIDDGDTAYILDVSSLGAEKPLKIESLKNYVGRYVNVHVNNAIEGNNIFEGDLIEVTDDSITIEYRVKTRVKKLVILQSNIYKIRLAIKF